MRPYSLSIPLAPLLLIQGAYVRKKIVKLPEAEGERMGEAGTGPMLKLLIVGDSAAAGVGVAQQDQALLGKLTQHLSDRYRLTWHLEAKTGNTTDETLLQLDAMHKQKFDLVVISTGVNDVTSKLPVTTWRKQLLALHDLLEKKFEASDIYYSAIPPMGRFPSLPHPLRFYLGRRAKLFDRFLQQHVRGLSNATYVAYDGELPANAIAEDGFHPGEPAYDAWATRIHELHIKNCTHKTM